MYRGEGALLFDCSVLARHHLVLMTGFVTSVAVGWESLAFLLRGALAVPHLSHFHVKLSHLLNVCRASKHAEPAAVFTGI